MFERVVIGIDFGTASMEAAAWAATRLKPEELALVHVVRPLRPPSYLRGALVDPEAKLSDDVEAASRALHALREDIAPDAVVDVRTGDPAVELQSAAREHSADLVMIGARGRAQTPWGVPGRTAVALMTRAGVPVWFCRILPAELPRSVLAAVGAVPAGTEVIEAARTAQTAWGARADLIHVVDRIFVPRPDTQEVTQRSLDDAIRREAETWLGEQRRVARVRGTDVPLEVVIGDPASELLAAIHRGEHDLVVMRGAGPSSATPIDNVARALLSASPASLLRLPVRDESREAA